MLVISRNGSQVHPREKSSATAVSTYPTKPITKRVGELPPLQYGTIGVKAMSGGKKPLRFASYFPSDSSTILKRATTSTFTKKSNCMPGYTSGQDNKETLGLTRRVRFNLPNTDGETIPDVGKIDDGDAGVGEVNKSKRMAGEPRLRNRGSHQQQYSHNRREARYTRDLESTRRTYPEGTTKEKTPGGLKSNRRLGCNFVEHITYSEHITSVLVTASPGVRLRIHPTGRYLKGTLSPTANSLPLAVAPSPTGQAFLRAARDGDDLQLKDLLRNAALTGVLEKELNAVDSSGRTLLSYVASNGSIDLLEFILQLPGLDPNKADNEGNTPLHFAAQAGQIECLNCMLSRCKGIDIDARNSLGFTPLMKAALQGRNKCAKLLLFAGANPTLRDNGRGFRADQWARFCGRYVCADVIEKHARQRLLERSTSYGNWGGEYEIGTRIHMGKVIPVPIIPQQTSHGLKSKLKKVFRTSSGPHDSFSSARLVTQLTSAALCASSPVLPSGPTVPPVVKSLIKPLTVPRLQITLVTNNGDISNNNNNLSDTKTSPVTTEKASEISAEGSKPTRSKKKK